MTASDSSGGAAEAFTATAVDARTTDRMAMDKILAMTSYSFATLNLIGFLDHLFALTAMIRIPT